MTFLCQFKAKDKTEKARKNRDNATVQSQRSNSHMSDDAHNNSYGSNASTNRESVIMEENPPTIVPVPPPQPPPSTIRAKLGRQMTPMPGRFKASYFTPASILLTVLILFKVILYRSNISRFSQSNFITVSVLKNIEVDALYTQGIKKRSVNFEDDSR